VSNSYAPAKQNFLNRNCQPRSSFLVNAGKILEIKDPKIPLNHVFDE